MMIPYGKQNITQEDIKSVIEGLSSDFLTQGPAVKKFEDEFATYVSAKYAIAVANGTGALHLSVLALNLQPGEKVITTPITFSASANCVRYCGAEVVFADIDPQTYLISLDSVKKIIEQNPPGTFKGIIPVDFAGRAIRLDGFKELADEHGLWIIEDACHAPGAYFTDDNKEKQFCGNGKFADLTVFSFHPVKHITSGEGGMITTNNKKLYERILKLRAHGITRDVKLFSNDIEWAIGNAAEKNFDSYPGWYMEMQELGYNYRLTDFQSALGSSQLKRADSNVSIRKRIAKVYQEAFENKSWLLGQSGFSEEHSYHLYVVEVEDRLGLYNFLKSKQIFTQVHYIPVHLMPYYKHMGYKEGDFPNSELYYSRCLSLPMYPTLTNLEQEYVIDSIVSYYS